MSNQINLAELHGYFNTMLGSMNPIPDSPYKFNYQGTLVTATFDRLSDKTWRNLHFSY